MDWPYDTAIGWYLSIGRPAMLPFVQALSQATAHQAIPLLSIASCTIWLEQVRNVLWVETRLLNVISDRALGAIVHWHIIRKVIFATGSRKIHISFDLIGRIGVHNVSPLDLVLVTEVVCVILINLDYHWNLLTYAWNSRHWTQVWDMWHFWHAWYSGHVLKILINHRYGHVINTTNQRPIIPRTTLRYILITSNIHLYGALRIPTLFILSIASINLLVHHITTAMRICLRTKLVLISKHLLLIASVWSHLLLILCVNHLHLLLYLLLKHQIIHDLLLIDVLTGGVIHWHHLRYLRNLRHILHILKLELVRAWIDMAVISSLMQLCNGFVWGIRTSRSFWMFILPTWLWGSMFIKSWDGPDSKLVRNSTKAAWVHAIIIWLKAIRMKNFWCIKSFIPLRRIITHLGAGATLKAYSAIWVPSPLSKCYLSTHQLCFILLYHSRRLFIFQCITIQNRVLIFLHHKYILPCFNLIFIYFILIIFSIL